MSNFFTGDDGTEYLVQRKSSSSYGDVSSTHELYAVDGGKTRDFSSKDEWERCKAEHGL